MTLLATQSGAHAWGPVAHALSVAEGSGHWPVMNLPDYWGVSYAWEWEDVQLVVFVKPIFAWSHDCRRQGGTDAADGWAWVPWVPTGYGQPTGVPFAEWDMYSLIMKMAASHRDQAGLAAMLETTRGWLGHNTLDSAAHFNLFPGTPLNSTDYRKWAEHSVKEEFLDYFIAMSKRADALLDLTSEEGVWRFRVGAHGGHSGLMCLGQKCYRKNRQTVDDRRSVSGYYEPLTVSTSSSIAGEMDDNLHSMFTLTYDRYLVLLNALTGTASPVVDVDSLKLKLTADERLFPTVDAAISWANDVYVDVWSTELENVDAQMARMPGPAN